MTWQVRVHYDKGINNSGKLPKTVKTQKVSMQCNEYKILYMSQSTLIVNLYYCNNKRIESSKSPTDVIVHILHFKINILLR